MRDARPCAAPAASGRRNSRAGHAGSPAGGDRPLSRPRRVCGTAAAGWLAVAVLLGGCDTWFGEVEDPPLPGERISVMVHDRNLRPDPTLARQEIVLPPPQLNPEWPQAGGYANHAMHHLAIAEVPEQVWKADIGTPADDSQPRLPPPIVVGGVLYAMDAEHAVNAFDGATGERRWRVGISPEDEEDHITGGLAGEAGRIFASAGFAAVVALDAATGAELWRTPVDAPIHAPPTVRGERVFVVTVNNTLYALDVVSGQEAWTYRGIAEIASLIGGANPAVEGNVVVAPFTSGELVALQVENGRVLWADSLATRRRTDELANLSQIRAAPVIDRGRVFAVSYAGVMAAIDLRSGRRLWDVEIGGRSQPWVAGDYIYVLSGEGELVCLDRVSGGILWIVDLPGYEDMVDLKNPILWTGPVLALDRLVVMSSNGWALTVSPYDGRMLGRLFVSGPLSMPPIIADGTLFVLNDDAELLAFR